MLTARVLISVTCIRGFKVYDNLLSEICGYLLTQLGLYIEEDHLSVATAGTGSIVVTYCWQQLTTSGHRLWQQVVSAALQMFSHIDFTL